MATNEQDEELDWILEQVYGRTLHLKKPKAKAALQAWRDQHTKEAVEAGVRAKMVELRNQWGVWLDDSANDKQTIREIYDWLNREIDWHNKELSAPQQSTSPDGSAE